LHATQPIAGFADFLVTMIDEHKHHLNILMHTVML